MKKTNQSKDNINKTLTIIAFIMLACTLLYVAGTVINAYIDYRVDKYMIDNQVWYMLEECFQLIGPKGPCGGLSLLGCDFLDFYNATQEKGAYK